MKYRVRVTRVTKIILGTMQQGEGSLDKFIEQAKDQPAVMILYKRIVKCNLPRFEPSAYMFLSLLVDRPGTLVMALIDTLAKYDEIKPEKIDINFLCTHVYPYGFYKEEVAKKIYDAHRDAKPGKFDYLYF